MDSVTAVRLAVAGTRYGHEMLDLQPELAESESEHSLKCSSS
jgi:hypothetical protein